MRVGLTTSVGFRPCVTVDVGAVSAVTVGASHPRNPERAWADASLQGRLEWRVLTRLSLELEGGLLRPIVRDTFVFEPAPVHKAYEAPVVAGVGSIGVMAIFL